MLPARPPARLPALTHPTNPHSSPTPLPSQVLDILPGATIVVAIMLLTGCMSPEQARRAIRWVSRGRGSWAGLGMLP